MNWLSNTKSSLYIIMYRLSVMCFVCRNLKLSTYVYVKTMEKKNINFK